MIHSKKRGKRQKMSKIKIKKRKGKRKDKRREREREGREREIDKEQGPDNSSSYVLKLRPTGFPGSSVARHPLGLLGGYQTQSQCARGSGANGLRFCIPCLSWE